MVSIQSALIDLKRLDLLGRGDTSLHRLDARAKVVVTLVFILCVISYGRYELAALLPFFIFPVVMIALSSIPPFFIAKKIVLLIPFVLVVGAFNPLFDRETILQFGTLEISGGWVSCASILVRSTLTVGAALILVGMTGFTAICRALERLGMPQVFAVQLLFIYRYIFVLAEEAEKASRARDLRSCGKKGRGIRSFGSLIGHLLLRTWQRADRLHVAMLARGFTGQFRTSQQSHFGSSEICFVLAWSTLFIFLRLQNLSKFLGQLITGLIP